MFQPLWMFSVPLTSGLSSVLAVPDSVWTSVFFPPTFPLPWPCWILHNLQLRGCFCALAFPDPTPFWSTTLRHVLLIPIYLSLSPMRLWAPRRHVPWGPVSFLLCSPLCLALPLTDWHFAHRPNLSQAAFYVPPFVLIAQLNMTEQMTDWYL